MVTLADAAALHTRTIAVDGHRDVYEQNWQRSLGCPTPLQTITVPRLRRGGVSLVVYAICGDTIDHAYGTERYQHAALENLDGFYAEAEAPDAGMAVIRTAADVPERPDGRVHFLLHFEGGRPLEGGIGALRMFFRLGLRSLQVTWNVRNELGDGVHERRTGGGLTVFGVEAIREAHRLRMVVDLAHAAPATFFQALEVSGDRPIVVSHANAAALCDHPRNLTDEQLRALRENGGLIGAHSAVAFTDPERPTVDRLVDHIAHLAEQVGIDRVYLGPDFTKCDGPRNWRDRGFPGVQGTHLDGFEEIDDLPLLTATLLARGFREAEVQGILGDNFARFLRRTLPPA
jgi:membrane dipeptidase